MRNGNARQFITYLRSTGIPFYLKTSNYTTSIKSDLIKTKFVKTMQSKRTFAAFNRLKKDVKDKQPPAVNMDKLRYFIHNFKEDAYYEQVFNIDIKSAYATVLLNDGYITSATYEYLSKINKQERLASVGMLASKSQTFYFCNGEPVEVSAPDISAFAPFFYHSVQRTSEIMDELKAVCGNKYLFTWVDGIYFKPDEEIFSTCCEVLEKNGYKYSAEYLTDFKVVLNDVNVKVFFNKEGKTKLFNLPHATSDFKKVIVESMQLINSNQNLNNKQKSTL